MDSIFPDDEKERLLEWDALCREKRSWAGTEEIAQVWETMRGCALRAWISTEMSAEERLWAREARKHWVCDDWMLSSFANDWAKNGAGERELCRAENMGWRMREASEGAAFRWGAAEPEKAKEWIAKAASFKTNSAQSLVWGLGLGLIIGFYAGSILGRGEIGAVAGMALCAVLWLFGWAIANSAIPKMRLIQALGCAYPWLPGKGWVDRVLPGNELVMMGVRGRASHSLQSGLQEERIAKRWRGARKEGGRFLGKKNGSG